MINELDRVALTEAVPEHDLRPGDVGTVVLVHQEGKGFTIEFMTLMGTTIAVVTLPANAVRPLRAREVANAREVA
ncbi:MAG: DUF4926 domain-containing protein [Hyphomicrobiaceae bacterium]